MVNTFDALAEEVKKLLKVEEHQAVFLTELIDERIKELIEDRLDREFDRGDWRR